MTDPYVHEWIAKAEEDYLTAKALVRRRKHPLPNSVCFHCHQCAEKYLEAALAHRKKNIPKTHDLIVLLELLTPQDGEYELIRDVLRTLNPFAVEIRYPGETATSTQAKRAVNVMASTRAFIRERFGLR